MARPKSKPDIETKNINARIPKDLAIKLKVYCAQHEMTVQQFIIQAIEEKTGKRK